MRHLVYLLLVANLAFLGWNIFTANTRHEAVSHSLPLPDGVTQLVTLQEQRAAADSAVEEIESMTDTQPPGAGAAMLCQAMGPFLVQNDMLTVEGYLLDMGLAPAPRHLSTKELNGYWVYLPAMTREDVQQVADLLKDHNDSEYYVGKTNFISLGTFKDIERAERRLQEARAMGLDAVLEERYREQESWWLDIESDGSARDRLLGIVDRHELIQLVDLACY